MTNAMTAERPSLDRLVKTITEISTLPQVALRVMEVVNDAHAGAADLCRIVEADPSLGSRVLRCVNSAAYGMNERVTDLRRAIIFLGFNQVRNLAVTASVADVFRGNEPIGPYRRAQLWQHLVSVAVCARMIATRRSMPQFEETFLAGLLHDFGIILEDQYCHQPFAEMLQAIKPEDRLIQREQEYLGFDHTMLGYRIGKKWKFPDSALSAICYHHASETCRDAHAPVVACVELANFICTMCGRSSIGLALLDPPLSALKTLGVTRGDVKVLAQDLDEELERNRKLFNL